VIAEIAGLTVTARDRFRRWLNKPSAREGRERKLMALYLNLVDARLSINALDVMGARNHIDEAISKVSAAIAEVRHV
jgi:hypothetical protein